MSRVIEFLKMHAEDMRRQSKPNGVITEYVANQNARMAAECEFAAEALRLVYNRLFSDGILEGLKELAKNIEERKYQ